MAFEAVIGLECHIQLNTASKMFCDCPAEFGAAPNSNVCPVCLGMPGALPRVNRAAVDAAVRLGLALGCEVREESVFARKNYFYPDMPKNYQISQYDRPLCEGGALPVEMEGKPRGFALTRVHAEEDTGKSFHPERVGDRRVSRVDFNRAGVPLLELVTQPVFREAAECSAFLITLRRLVRWLGISEGDMEKGHLRCDANVSLRPKGQQAFGTKTEIKNLNSIKAVEKGIVAEIARQTKALEAGERIEQATLLYDADHDRLAVMRSKEHAHDYRYFPEPDLPVLRVIQAWLDDARARMPELPWVRAERIASMGVKSEDALVLSDDKVYSDVALDVLSEANDKQLAANYLVNNMTKHWKELTAAPPDWVKNLPDLPDEWRDRIKKIAATLKPNMIEFVNVTAVTYPRPLANSVLEEIFRTGSNPNSIVVERGYQVTGEDELKKLVREVIESNPGPVSQYLGGKAATLGFLVGQVMKKSGGQAVPQTVQELLREELAKRG